MSALQEALAVLLGAESEAKREVEDSRDEGERLVRKAKDDFARDREQRMNAVRDQAKSILDVAKDAAEKEASTILSSGREEVAGMRRRFDENARRVVELLVAEVVERYARKGA